MDLKVVYIGSQLIFGILYLVLLFLRHIANRGQHIDKLDAVYCLFLVTIALDCVWRLIDGVPAYRTGHIALELAYLSVMSFSGYVWFLYTLDLFPAKLEKLRKYRFVLGIPVLFEIALVFTSLGTGWIFSVDETGTYIRGPFSMGPVALNYLYMLLGSYVALQCRKEALLAVDKRRFAAAAFFPVPVLVLSGLQVLLPPGLPSMQAGVLIGLLLFYGMSQSAMVSQDYLTGLPNRFTFEQDLAERMHMFRAGGARHLYLMEGDLNKFKQINDTYGHPEGDKVLLQTAEILEQVFHPHGAAVFRTGGDEFMMLAETEGAFDIGAIGEELNTRLAEIEVPGGLSVSMSLGLVEFDGSQDARALVKKVDERLYAAKKAALD